PEVFIADAELMAALDGLDFAEICITSDIMLKSGEGPADAFRADDGAKVSVVPTLAEGRKCARSWKITKDVGSDPDYPDVSARDAQALRELAATK
ncbi:MAG: isoleucine-tRNA ligase, partial [Pseudomonadota bacterium]